MLGRYYITNDCVRFEPRFPLEPGKMYHAIFRSSRLPGATDLLTKDIVSNFRAPALSAIGDSGDANLSERKGVAGEFVEVLRVLQRSNAAGHIYEHIRLLDQTGSAVDLPFLEIDEELWNAEMTRLTLFIDPGRIKRGVQPLEEIGPVLEEGKSYTLVIDRNWQDADGLPLKQSYRKPFKAGPSRREPIVTGAWKVTPPAAGSVGALLILFPEPLDHALARRLIRVANKNGQEVPGQTSLGGEERSWSFVPAQKWVAGAYQILVQTTIEDLAGNNIGKPFEVDLFEGVGRRVSNAAVFAGHSR
jgi:hypothetical protein